MTTGRALVPMPGGSRRAHLREWRRESLWLWPAVAALVAWAAGDLAARYLHNFSLHQGVFPTDLDDARTLLATIAAALLTFTGVVFSITLVALQMASTQYSPRVLRTFVRKPVTKLALSTFIATFVYALALLARVGSTTRAHTVPQGAVAVAYLLVMASVLVFVFFVHSTVRSMRVSYVIEAVFVETSHAMDVLFAPLDAYREVTMPERQSPTASIAFDRRDAVVDGIDAYRLVELATQHRCVLECSVPVGTFVTSGSELVRVHGGSALEGREVLTTFNCSAVRTLYQDPCYGIRQLVDIAIRALSPAVNDPTTAVQALDRLHALVRAVVARPIPPVATSTLRTSSAWSCPFPAGTAWSAWPSPRSPSTGRTRHRSRASSRPSSTISPSWWGPTASGPSTSSVRLWVRPCGVPAVGTRVRCSWGTRSAWDRWERGDAAYAGRSCAAPGAATPTSDP